MYICRKRPKEEADLVDTVPRGGVGQLWSAFITLRERRATDAELLGRFVRNRDERAFSELVRRMGPTVYGVCRRMLRNTADADDAFQVTFLVLSRRASTVNPPGKVSAWVYGVAVLTSRKLRQTRLRRLNRERAVHPLPEAPVAEREVDHEFLPAVDEELTKLPDKFRVPIVLCGMRGLTIEQAAAELGWPVGTVASRLSRGRARLSGKLAKRGIALSLLASASGGSELTAGVPPQLHDITLKAAGGMALPAVNALTNKVVTAMKWTPIFHLSAGLFCSAATALVGVNLFLSPIVAAPVTSRGQIVTPEPKSTLDRVRVQDVGGLIRQESVRKEIGLSNDDYKALSEFRDNKMSAIHKQIENDIQNQLQAQGGGIGGGEIHIDTTLQNKLTADADVEYSKKVCEKLKPEGLKRLKQAVMQMAGPRALLDRLTIRELQLTVEQEDKLDLLLTPNKQIDFISNTQMAKMVLTRDTEYAEALKVLTAEQRKRWDALVGKAFPTVDLLNSHPMSEESISEQTKWAGAGLGGAAGNFVPAIPVPAVGVPIAPPAVALPQQEKEKENKVEKKK